MNIFQNILIVSTPSGLSTARMASGVAWESVWTGKLSAMGSGTAGMEVTSGKLTATRDTEVSLYCFVFRIMCVSYYIFNGFFTSPFNTLQLVPLTTLPAETEDAFLEKPFVMELTTVVMELMNHKLVLVSATYSELDDTQW